MFEVDEPETFSPAGMAIASGSILALLLVEMVDKGFFETDEIRAVLQRADSGVAIMPDTEATADAHRFISYLFRLFPEQSAE
jgi:hypothetical protein